MNINQDIINMYFKNHVTAPNGNVLSKEGFEILANWCERQWWWERFARYNDLKSDWRESDYMSDPYVFAITVYNLLVGDDSER